MRVPDVADQTLAAGCAIGGGHSVARLAADVAGLRRLYDLQSKLAFETDLKAALGQIVEAAADLTGTDRGCVQLVSKDGERLEMFVHRGYGPESGYIRHFLHEVSKPACDAARQHNRRIVIEDVATFPALLGTKDRQVALAEDVRACQSTPMISRKGDLVGVLSTQFRAVHRPGEHELKLVDMLAWAAADFVDRHKTEAALRRANEARHLFLLNLADAERRLTNPIAIMAAADEALAQELGAVRVGHSELDDAGEILVVRHEHRRPDLPAATGPARLRDFGEGLATELAAGRTVAIADVASDPRTADRAAAHAAFDTRALLAVPLVRGGRVRATLHVNSGLAREWAASEVALVEEVAARTWAAVERARAEERLRASEERQRKTLEIDTVAVAYFDMVGGITDANDAFLRLIGYTRAELEAGDVRYERLTPSDWAGRDRQTIAELRATGRSGPFEKQYLRRDGSPMWILCASKMLDARTAVEFIIDLTERKEAEERERLLAREVDHRAKNMLGVIQSIVQLTRADDAASLKKAITGRIQSLARAHSLLAASRWEGVDLKELVAEQLAPFTPREAARVGGPALRLRPAAAQALAMVLHELATNASKHGSLSTSGGRLDVSWGLVTDALGQRQLELRWIESGGPAVRPPTRAGFGKTVIRGSVERQLRGQVTMDWAPDGLTCDLAVPAEQLVLRKEQVARAAARPAAPAALGGLRVLVVEDEALIAMQVESVLADAGCELVGPASGVAEAVGLVTAAAPQAALLDVNLGRERSYPVADLLAAGGVPFVFCTGYAGATELPERFAGARVLPKPLDPDELVRALADVAAGPRPRSQMAV